MKITLLAKQLHANSKWTNTSTGEVYDDVTRSMAVFQGFTKPDKPTIVPKDVDGFRRPTSYHCPAFSEIGKGSSAGFRICEVNGKGLSLGHFELDISGKTAIGFAGSTNPWYVPTPNVNALRSKLLNNVRNEVLDVAMVLAEMQGTTNIIVNGLMRIARSMDAVKKGNPRHYSFLLSGKTKDNRRPTDKFLRESAGVFLEWKYGIMPTVYDIAGATKALDMAEDGSLWDNPPLLVGRAVETVSETGSQRGRVHEPQGGWADVDVPVERFSQYKARIDYSVKGEGLRGLNRYGIGLSSIPTVLFDRTPFSFVLNMAIPISELIKAWTALAGCEVRGYCETLYQRAAFPEVQVGVTIRNVPCTVTLTKQEDWVSWKRDAFPTIPMPLPYVRNPIKTGNLATVLALFTQLRRP